MAAARVWPELARHPRRCDRPGRRGAAGGRAPVKEQASAGEAPRRQPAQDSSRRLPPHRHGSPQGPARRSGPAHRGGTAGSTRSALATGAAARVRERAGGASSWRRVGKGGRVATEAAGGRAGSRRALRRSGCRVGGGCVRGASPGSAPPRPAAPRRAAPRRGCPGTSGFICHQLCSPAQLSKQGVSFSFQLTKYQRGKGL